MLALQESDGCDSGRKEVMIQMQASTVLAGMYSKRAQSQLQGAEEQNCHKTGKRKMGNSKTKYFSGDDFYRLCEEDKEKRLEETRYARANNHMWPGDISCLLYSFARGTPPFVKNMSQMFPLKCCETICQS
jgi:hypothetical protein